MDEEKTTDSKKSKPWRQMLKSESSDNDELTKLLNSDLKKPRMTRSEKQLNKKLDYLIKNNVKPDELQSLTNQLQKLSDKVDKNNEEVQKKLRDQNSDVLKAVSDAQAIGYSDGLVDRVDSLEQKVDGLESDINLREQNLDQKTQECIAKAADLNEAGKYLEHYTQTVNNRLVPTLRNLILSIQNGITHHTSEVTNDVYQHFQDDTGKTIDEVVKSTVNQQFKQDREDAQQASLSARMSAKVSQQNVDKMSIVLDTFLKFIMVVGVEMVILLLSVSLTPRWWKLLTFAVLIGVSGIFDYILYRKKVANDGI
ncbi:hypothetical protein N4599_07675 [Limosilactobacillus oris]|uniref:hypothetical protein n=1 Tax=Limosilactobacillus oris TaxID=1632 RepID=UPI0021B39117|nr:hypothetical protein [Limosilactobacillus oris]UXC66999.1 hypothetical protein N4599_07675 [Limosilactobacillus oris]